MGAPLVGRIVIIDDVLTSGKAIREAISIIASHPDAKLVGIVQLVDRQERGAREGETRSTVQEVEDEFGVPVEPVLGMSDLMAYLEKSGGREKELGEMRVYEEKYGVREEPRAGGGGGDKPRG